LVKNIDSVVHKTEKMEDEGDGSAAQVIEKPQRLREHRTNIRVSIIGMPNSGKTSIFNLLTGKNADVDVSFDSKMGYFLVCGLCYHLLNTPCVRNAPCSHFLSHIYY
jgi:GTP1/Obg family GTP-binding protein